MVLKIIMLDPASAGSYIFHMRNNNDTAFRDLYGKYGAMVLRRCRAILKNEDDAFDAMQDCFVKIMESGDIGAVKYPSSYLFRAATNICLNRIRDGAKASGNAEGIEAIASADDSDDRFHAGELIDKIFRRVHVTLKEAAVMYHIDKMTHAQIASATGLSVSGVRRRLDRFTKAAKEIRGGEDI
jgi:RNA polymerase sigma-70 factor (ECF subfamily)